MPIGSGRDLRGQLHPDQDRGKRLHTRNHKSEIPSETATENPSDLSSNNSTEVPISGVRSFAPAGALSASGPPRRPGKTPIPERRRRPEASRAQAAQCLRRIT